MARGAFEVNRLELSDPAQLEDAAVVATRAFQFDPFFVHLSPRPLLRARGLAIFWRSQLGALGEAAEAYGARRRDGRLAGVAIWIKPTMYPLSPRAQLRQSLGALRALWPRPRALLDGAKYLLSIDSVHPKVPVWYLNLLVADPSDQRSGIGTALQQPVLQHADAEGLPAYLETQNQDNLAYYRRFGYEVAHELHPVAKGPPLWTMWRDPRP
ncbi:MAG: GNAT family N-acetyltransferase [Acidimicrobiales bacterium]